VCISVICSRPSASVICCVRVCVCVSTEDTSHEICCKLGHTSKLRTSAVYKSPILWLCLGIVGLGSAGLVWLALELGLALALVLGLMSSVDMKRVCVCVCVRNVGMLKLDA